MDVKESLRLKAICALVGVAFLYASMNVAVRFLHQGFDTFTQIYLRIGFGFVIGLSVFGKKIRIRIIQKTSLKDWLILFMMGFGGFGMFVYFVTLGALEAKLLNISVILGVAPLFTYLYSLVFFKEKIKPIIIFFLFLSLIGISFIAGKSYGFSLSQFGRGEFYVLVSAALLGLFFIGRRMLSKHLNNTEITLITMGIACVTNLIFALGYKEPFVLQNVLNPIVMAGLVIGGFGNILSTKFETFAFQHIHPVIGSQILLSENIFSLFLGLFLYRELFGMPEFIGSALVIVSVYFANKYLAKK